MIKKILYLTALATIALMLHNTRTIDTTNVIVNPKVTVIKDLDLEKTQREIAFTNNTAFDLTMKHINGEKTKDFMLPKGSRVVVYQEAQDAICTPIQRPWLFIFTNSDKTIKKPFSFMTATNCLERSYEFRISGNKPNELEVKDLESESSWYE